MNNEIERLQKEKESLKNWLEKIYHNNPEYDDGFLQEWINTEIKKIDDRINDYKN